MAAAYAKLSLLPLGLLTARSMNLSLKSAFEHKNEDQVKYVMPVSFWSSVGKNCHLVHNEIGDMWLMLELDLALNPSKQANQVHPIHPVILVKGVHR